MHRTRANGDGVVERARKRVLPFALAPRQRGKPGLSLAADRRVDAELRQAMARNLRAHRWRAMLIRSEQLHGRKAGGGRSAEALHEGPLGEQPTEIGGEAGHAASLSRPKVKGQCEGDRWFRTFGPLLIGK